MSRFPFRFDFNCKMNKIEQKTIINKKQKIKIIS